MGVRTFGPEEFKLGRDFVITLNGEVIPDAMAAHSTSDINGTFGWIETPSGVVFGCVEFRPLHA